jgi:cellulose synthase/poly-beta-1,6-N-acetylglucosamine synthase-like glycosyltransferase
MGQMISIIVPAYNEQELIAGCLDSLLCQDLDKNQYEIIVIDNHSTDLTSQIALDKGVRVEEELKKGYVHTIRKGIEVAQADIIAFTDADCRVPTDWLNKILEHFLSWSDVIAVGGKLTFYDLHPVLNIIARIVLYFNKALPGNNMAIRREAIQRIGGIDPAVNLALDYWLTVKLRKVGRIKIDKSILVMTSGRRFTGSFSSDIKYFINVISIYLTSKPLFYEFPDVRKGVN